MPLGPAATEFGSLLRSRCEGAGQNGKDEGPKAATSVARSGPAVGGIFCGGLAICTERGSKLLGEFPFDAKVFDQ